ncbi:MAG: amylo-alpha-1,6-glucosidase [Planctomycetota bacterium]
MGQLAEIHDAASPHAARGCPAQAWSVAEALRVRVLLAS